MSSVRESAVAGTFYPAQKELLSRGIEDYLKDITPEKNGAAPKALIVPHAGYMYSGAVAAAAYSCLAGHANEIKRVVLLGPAHRCSMRGLAYSNADYFHTPMGDVPVDLDAIHLISGMKQVSLNAQAHALEHSLEVQLPFLQSILGDFKIVPLVVGEALATEVSDVLDKLWGGSETLIVVSSDLSHYLPYDRAQRVDEFTINKILSLLSLDTFHQACGAIPINGLLLSVRRHQLQPKLLKLCNSGDTAGDKKMVVGYCAISFSGEDAHG